MDKIWPLAVKNDLISLKNVAEGALIVGHYIAGAISRYFISRRILYRGSLYRAHRN